ncbi:MAG: metallophosphoesterase family protein [Spirochaetales bacterium]|nr:metallophosphoesterase family protein [Spirochaetales bacterium]
MESIGIISDIHGNSTALTEVLASLKEHAVIRIICLGDLVGKGPQSALAIELCREHCDVVVKGNWDDFILKNHEDDELQWHYDQLNQEQIRYLGTLPESYEFSFGNKNIRLFHSSSRGIYNRVHMHDSYENHAYMFENTDFTGNRIRPDVVGYGDIHGALIKYFNGRILFNTGSVGNPLDINQASYVIIEENEKYDQKSLDFIFKRVLYDVEKELDIARRMRMPKYGEYEKELKTAVYRHRKQ